MDSILTWLLEFTHFEGEPNLWNILNSQAFLNLVVAPIGFLFYQAFMSKSNEVDDLKGALKAVDEAQQQLDQSFSEGGSVSAGKNADLSDYEADHSIDEPLSPDDYREKGLELADKMKAFIEEKMKKDPDGRHRRTYRSISGHLPVARAAALQYRDQISEKQEHAIATFFSIWNGYSKGRGANRKVPYNILSLMEKQWQIAQSSD